MPEAAAIPRVTIAALRGGSGKTVLSIGLIAAFRHTGKTVFPFKKGPDYIDAGWLALAAGRPCYNLDTFMADENAVCGSFIRHFTPSGQTDLALIEGNRGLYDGLDADGSTSTASLAKLLKSPVVLCLDCTKATRTMSAVVLGCLHFDPMVDIQGVILNRVAGSRHENILRQTIETHCRIPVIGAVPKLSSADFPERHMGLMPAAEHEWAIDAIAAAARMAARHVDLGAIERIAMSAAKRPVTCPLPHAPGAPSHDLPRQGPIRPRIGVLRDSAFQFYYPDNLQALIQAGADILYVSPLTDIGLPNVDALYIGGGFPETHARELAQNIGFRNEVRAAAAAGLPIYAECGGLMYLGESLVLDQSYPMAGVLPITVGLSQKPQGHGYTIARVDGENPFFAQGTILKGHEFHYSRVLSITGACPTVFAMEKGHGMTQHRDGMCRYNVLATYTHIHAAGVPQWAENMVRLARLRRNE